MPRRHRFFSCAAAVVVSVAVVNSATAAGYYNLPSNLCQWMGCGYGPGHHACLVLGPTSRDCCQHGEVRMPCAPSPHAGCHRCQLYSRGGCGDGHEEATVLEGEVTAPEPVVAPTPAEIPAAFLQRRIALGAHVGPAAETRLWSQPATQAIDRPQFSPTPAPAVLQPADQRAPRAPAATMPVIPQTSLFGAPVQL
jgi:hypothetical protein